MEQEELFTDSDLGILNRHCLRVAEGKDAQRRKHLITQTTDLGTVNSIISWAQMGYCVWTSSSWGSH